MSKGMGPSVRVVRLLWGLPASGKTTWAEERVRQQDGYFRYGSIGLFGFNQRIKRLDLDPIYQKTAGDELKFALAVGKLVEKNIEKTEELILDGLCTTNQTAMLIFDNIARRVGPSGAYRLSFQIEMWTCNRENCLHNDRGRRELSSEHTIKTLPFEVPDTGLLGNYVKPKHVKRHKVVRRPDSEIWAEDKGMKDTQAIKSNDWSLGGVRHGWGGYSSQVSPQPQPVSFAELDELLEKVAPTLSFPHGKRIYRECVTVKEWEDRDYYGGSIYKAHYECDIEKVYSLLKELGYIGEADVPE